MNTTNSGLRYAAMDMCSRSHLHTHTPYVVSDIYTILDFLYRCVHSMSVCTWSAKCLVIDFAPVDPMFAGRLCGHFKRRNSIPGQLTTSRDWLPMPHPPYEMYLLDIYCWSSSPPANEESWCVLVVISLLKSIITAKLLIRMLLRSALVFNKYTRAVEIYFCVVGV